MVLQSGAPLTLSGRAKPATTVTLQLDNRATTTESDANGAENHNNRVDNCKTLETLPEPLDLKAEKPGVLEAPTEGWHDTGDIVEIDIPNRTISLVVDPAELERRRAEQDAKGWFPAEKRKRNVTTALKAYAAFASSADKGAVRQLPE